MIIAIYSKKDCGKCKSAKEKLERMNLHYEEHDMEYHTTYHENWRDDDSVDVLAAHSDMNILPLLCVDGVFYDYPEAIKVIKDKLKNEKT